MNVNIKRLKKAAAANLQNNSKHSTLPYESENPLNQMQKKTIIPPLPSPCFLQLPPNKEKSLKEKLCDTSSTNINPVNTMNSNHASCYVTTHPDSRQSKLVLVPRQLNSSCGDGNFSFLPSTSSSSLNSFPTVIDLCSSEEES